MGSLEFAGLGEEAKGRSDSRGESAAFFGKVPCNFKAKAKSSGTGKGPGKGKAKGKGKA